jgi:hypothetical protein
MDVRGNAEVDGVMRYDNGWPGVEQTPQRGGGVFDAGAGYDVRHCVTRIDGEPSAAAEVLNVPGSGDNAAGCEHVKRDWVISHREGRVRRTGRYCRLKQRMVVSGIRNRTRGERIKVDV